MNAQTFARLHKAQVRSNISIAAFCRKRGLALSSYHYWRRRYGSASRTDGFVEVQFTAPSHLSPLSPVLPKSPAVVEQPIGLLFRGANLSLPAHFSPSALRLCIEVLRETLPC